MFGYEHIWYWNQEGCDKNSKGMDMKNAHRRLKGTLPEDSEDSEAELEDKDLEEEDEEEILEEEDFDIVEEQPKRAPRRSKRKRKRSPSPPIPDLSDNEDTLPPEVTKIISSNKDFQSHDIIMDNFEGIFEV